ncbi:ArsS family sensor histidine kinase [Campylobacter sp. CCS1377]|uniref:histidine kinase n=1 Tax=Campylobacter sp. CCS1377 TaxID=3158229 RepID=A0AAU7E7I3_9BACT
MKSCSIYTKVTFLFVVTFFIACLLFFILIHLAIQTYQQTEISRQRDVIHYLNAHVNQDFNDMEFQHFLSTRGFRVLKNQDNIAHIVENGEMLFQVSDNKDLVFSSIWLDNRLYLDIGFDKNNMILEPKVGNKIYNFLLFAFLFYFCLTAFLYFSVLNSLTPLKKLKNQIAKTAQNQEFTLDGYEDNEIGQIAVEFNNVMQKNQELVHSRKLFMRTIMHELKTPIGKGMIIAEMSEDKYKQRLIAIFGKLDLLISEAGKMESLLSGNTVLLKNQYTFSEILTQAKDFLLLDDFDKMVKVEIYEDAVLYVNLEVFSLVLKNLIDNALKYSYNHTCEVQSYKDYFVVKNKGEELKYPIGHYLQAFTRGENDKGIEGMGLGLYIVARICQIFDFVFAYDYVDEFHCFKVLFNNVNTKEKKSLMGGGN